jgi:hypothetical protein
METNVIILLCVTAVVCLVIGISIGLYIKTGSNKEPERIDAEVIEARDFEDKHKDEL